jgi:acyl carrier protein
MSAMKAQDRPSDLDLFPSGLMDAHEEIIAEIIKATGAPASGPVAVTASSRIKDDLGLDSLAVMNFVMVLEDRFDVSIPIDSLNEIKTVGDLAKVISELKH